MNCEECKENRVTIPYIVHESNMARMERIIKRLWILMILLVLMLVGTNAAWICYESQWQTVETTEVSQDVDTGEGDAYVAGIGDVYYGEGQTNSQEN